MNRYFVTRNRRDGERKFELDEIVDGRPTGKIVLGYDIKDGELVVRYKEHKAIPEGALVTDPVIVRKDHSKTPVVVQPEEKKGWEEVVDEDGAPVDLEALDRVLNTPKVNEAMRALMADYDPAMDEDVPFRGNVTYIVEFDWAYGHEEVVCETEAQAQAYPDLVRNYYKGFTFSNFSISREYRSKREEVPVKDKNEEKKA